MSNSLYITATEARSEKSAICLGVMEMLFRRVEKAGFFRPIIHVDPRKNERDNDIDLITVNPR